MNYDSTSDTLELSEHEALELISRLAIAIQHNNKTGQYGIFRLPCIANGQFASAITFIVKD